MSDVRDFGAVGDGQADDTAALQHAIDQNDGVVHLPRGRYRLEAPLVVDLAKCGPVAIEGNTGTATLIMQAPGPALSIRGSHTGTADPAGVTDRVWLRERLPSVRHLEIVGQHPEADGIELTECWQPTLGDLGLHDLRHGIRLHRRVRNLLIQNCHIYHNRGIGVFFDQVNLHQTNIVGNHISYNARGGIRIEESEIRNLQITGNDIEYNNVASHDLPTAPTAEIYLDCGETGSIRELTIVSNTIQSTASPQGANVRLIGTPDSGHRLGMLTLSGNLLGSQETNVWAERCRGLVVSGNYVYGAEHRNLRFEDCSHLVLTGNCLGANPDYQVPVRQLGVRFERCEGVTFGNNLLQGMPLRDEAREVPEHSVLKGLLELIECRRVQIGQCQFADPAVPGLWLERCDQVQVLGCQLWNEQSDPPRRFAVVWQGQGAGNTIRLCQFQAGRDGTFSIDEVSGVEVEA